MTRQVSEATARLCGGTPVTRAQLAALPAPRALGRYHRPVAHADLLDTLARVARQELNARITAEQYALRRGGDGLFGVITLTYGATRELSAAIGLRHANDRSMSLQLVAGMTVFVCENMVLSGNTVILRKRHTLNMPLATELTEAMARLKGHFGQLTIQVDRWRARKLTDTAAKAMLYDTFTRGLLPLRLLLAAGEAYFNPRHAAFRPRTVWSLHNACTEVAKQVPLAARLAAIQELTRLLARAA